MAPLNIAGRFLTRTEAAEQLKLGRSTVDNMIAKGELDSVRVGRRRLVRAESVADFQTSPDAPRQAATQAADLVARTAAEQGLPLQVADAAVLRRVAALIESAGAVAGLPPAAALRMLEIADSGVGHSADGLPPKEENTVTSTTVKVPQHLGLDDSKWYSPAEAAAVLRCSRSLVYDLMARGDLTSVKNGRKRLIPGSSIAGSLGSLAAATA